MTIPDCIVRQTQSIQSLNSSDHCSCLGKICHQVCTGRQPDHITPTQLLINFCPCLECSEYSGTSRARLEESHVPALLPMRPGAPEVLERPHRPTADRHTDARLLIAAHSAQGISVSQPALRLLLKVCAH